MGNMRRQRRQIERQQIAQARRERRRVLSRFAADQGITYQEALDLEAQLRHEQRDREAIAAAREVEQAWPEEFVGEPDPQLVRDLEHPVWQEPTPAVEAFRRIHID